MSKIVCSMMAMMVFGSLGGCRGKAIAEPPAIPPRPTVGAPIDRIGRPLTANALLAPLAPDEISDRRKEAYNRAAQGDWPQFEVDIRHTLGLYDGFDGTCGNQWLADTDNEPRVMRYHRLATLLADDRIWINSKSSVCTQYLAVERAAFGRSEALGDCGGRTPNYDVTDVFRSLLVFDKTSGVDDGIAHDDRVHSNTEFPFLAAP